MELLSAVRQQNEVGNDVEAAMNGNIIWRWIKMVSANYVPIHTLLVLDVIRFSVMMNFAKTALSRARLGRRAMIA